MIRSLGIDIGSKNIKIAEVHFSQGVRQVVDLVRIPVDKTEGPWAALRQFLISRPQNEESLAIGLGRRPVVLKKFTFPFSDRMKVESAIRSDFEDSLPFELTNYVLNFRLVSRAGKMHEYIAGLCHTSDLEELNQRFEENHLRPTHVGVDAEALGQLALHQCLPASLQSEPYLVIDIGYTSTKLAFLKGHQGSEFFKDIKNTPEIMTEIMEMRNLSRGTSEIVEWMADRKNLSLEDAEQWLNHRAEIVMKESPSKDVSQLGIETSDEIKTALRPVIVEIYQTLQAFRGQYDTLPKVAYLTGGAGQLKGFSEFLAHELRLEVVPWEIFKGFDVQQVAVNASHQNEFALALGLAHRFTIVKSRGWLNFKRSTVSKRKFLTQGIQFLEREDLRPVLGFVLGFWALLFVYMIGSQFLLSKQLTEVRKSLVVEFQKFDPDLGRKAQKVVLDVSKSKEMLSVDVKKRLSKISLGDQNRAKIEFLLDLSELLPSKTQIKTLQIESQGPKQKMVSSFILQEGVDERQLRTLKETLSNDFKERGYSTFNVEKASSGVFKLSAVWGGQSHGSND